MTQEELTSAFEEFKTYTEALMSDEVGEGAIDWDTIDKEYIFKNVQGSDIKAVFDSFDVDGIRVLLGDINRESGSDTGLMTNPSIINSISMQGYDIKKESDGYNSSISFAARDNSNDYSAATPTCCTIVIVDGSDTETGWSTFYVKGIPQIVTEGYIRFKKCPALSNYKSAYNN